jgi:hypothetical protein
VGEKEMKIEFWSEILKESDYWEKYAWMEGCVITDLTYVCAYGVQTRFIWPWRGASGGFLSVAFEGHYFLGQLSDYHAFQN